MRFQVPQFTQTETKLIGPFNLRQFLWFLGAGLIILFAQFFTAGIGLIAIAAVAIGIAAACAYIKIDALTLPQYLLSGLVFFLNPKKFEFKNPENPDGQPK